VAKKKPRTPPPPRRVQAPKQRHAPRQGLDPARRRAILYGAGAAGLVGLAVVLIVVLAGGGGGGSGAAGDPAAIAATMRAAGCTVSTSKSAPSAQHITSLNQKVTYSTYPPVSGKHYYRWAIWGNYTQVVDPRQAVHNEEHGGIDIWVGPGVSSAERAQISAFYDESPDAMLVTPIEDTAQGVTYPKHAPPGSKIFLTAWTVAIKNGNLTDGKNVIATCSRFDQKAFTAFRDEFRGKGPERFSVGSLTPGT
jgi:Protein of unknown function (DUF3105)